MSFTFPGYDIGEQLHDGAGSHIYRAIRQADKVSVVLKVLKPAYPPPERIARFKREYENLRGLETPGVVKAFALETDERRWAIVQEDLGGQSLERLLADKSLSLTDRLKLAVESVEALRQVHEHHLIHKDINPSNIVCNLKTGRVALIDFGIAARLSRESPPLRHQERLEGTLAYISPEQTGRMNRDIDHRSDFYSFGVMLYELLTGKRPFDSKDAMELVHCHLARRPDPPHRCNPEVPEALSAIVMKLMSKTTEARYQGSYGLKADLVWCLKRLQSNLPLELMALGSKDVPEHFQIPQKLYGRESQVAELLTSFERVALGSDSRHVEMVLVSGYSGVGKSALVRELYAPITARRGHFAAGKFDQLQRSTPYSAVVAALRGLVRQLLGEPQDRLAHWREQLLGALGANARLIIDVLPELELIVGPRPPVAEFGPTEAKYRFSLVFQAFIRTLARQEHPLVLFLDDLQWADSASLKLIELMMTDSQPAHLLLLGAYRDNEVDSTHLLRMLLDTLARGGVTMHAVHLHPLSREHITELVADTLHASQEEVQPLAELVARKTEGNPLFATQLLRTLHDDELITLDREQGRWRWDITRINDRGFSDNVVELMAGSLCRLPQATQQAVQLAASLGNRFSLDVLGIVREQPLPEVFDALLPAVLEGLLLPSTETDAELAIVSGGSLAAREYRFLHDRVQQAAYTLVDEHERKSVHLRAGRALLRSLQPAQRLDSVFALADQLNHGRELIHDSADRVELAQLNLLAGRKAKREFAYAAARDYLSCGMEVMSPESWERQYTLVRDLHQELAQVESLLGNHVRAMALSRELLERLPLPIEKAEIHNLIIDQHTMLARYSEVLKTARSGLALLEIDLPADNFEPALAVEAAAIHALMGDRPIASLLDSSVVQEPRARTAMKLLVNSLAASFYLSPVAYGLGILKTVRMSLEYGLSPHSSDLFSYYGHLLSIQGQHRIGYEFAELSVRLSDKYQSPGDRCRSCFILANFVLSWTRHLREAREINEQGYQAGLESGEFRFGGYILFYKLLHRFYEGMPLAMALEDLPASLQFARRVKNQLAIDFLTGFRLAISALTGAEDPATEVAYLQDCEQTQSTMAACYYHILRTQTLYLLRQPEAARAASAAAERMISSIVGNIAVAEHTFYTSLTLAMLLHGASPEERVRLLEQLRAHLGTLTRWAESCPENFTHMRELVSAELARSEDQLGAAIDHYERAIQAAHRHQFFQDEALSNELAGRFWMEQGKSRLGSSYLAEARYGYEQWGAHLKVKQLSMDFPELSEQERRPQPGSTYEQSTDLLDLESVLEASRTISSELFLDKLIAKLMHIVVENAGATRGVLLLRQGDELVVRAEATLSTGETRQGPVVHALEPYPVTQYEAIPEALVIYVQRTRETVILADATREGDFTHHPYVLRYRPQSLLAMPLSSQGKPVGVMYLENNLTVSAFTLARIELLKVLSAQIGTSLENALLYEQMEQKVAERTAELARKNTALEQALGELKTTQSQLLHVEKPASLGRLTAGIAHELKNPLNFIRNFAEVNADLADEVFSTFHENPRTRFEEVKDTLLDIKKGAARIVEHSLRADGIIRGMMQHASGSRGERRRVDLNALVEQNLKLACQTLQAQFSRRQVHVESRLAKEAGELEVIPQELGQVLTNLLNNAFYSVLQKQARAQEDYVPSVGVSTRRLPSAVELIVEDNGTGIPVDIRGKIFEPFFTTKPPGEGTGLGLSLSYDIVVQMHGGTLTMNSEEGRGATFTVKLPA